MKITAAKCPNCGANIQVDEDSDRTKCEFCRAQIFVEEAIAKIRVEHTGTIKIDGIEGNNAVYDKAKKYIKLGEYNKAREILGQLADKDDLDVESRVLLYIATMKLIEQKMSEDKEAAEALLSPDDITGVDLFLSLKNCRERAYKIADSADQLKPLKKYEDQHEKYVKLIPFKLAALEDGVHKGIF